MRTFAIVLAALCVLPVLGAVSSTGAYVGAGPSTITDKNGQCVHEGPAELALHPDAAREGGWAFTLQRVTGFPVDRCAGVSFSSETWPSVLAGHIVGSPEAGFHGAGGASLAGSPWDLTVSSVGLQTTWSLHRVQFIEGYGEYHSWWNGTAIMAGAHV